MLLQDIHLVATNLASLLCWTFGQALFLAGSFLAVSPCILHHHGVIFIFDVGSVRLVPHISLGILPKSSIMEASDLKTITNGSPTMLFGKPEICFHMVSF